MQEPEKEQRGFSSILFDTLFGLVIFVSFEGLLSVSGLAHLTVYLLVVIVIVHWWLLFKSADDRFASEVENSVLDIVLGICYLVLLEILTIAAREDTNSLVAWLMVCILLLDTFWAVLWRFAGRWRTKDQKRIRAMEHELHLTLGVDLVFIVILSAIAFVGTHVENGWFVVILAAGYLAYIISTFRTKILNIHWF
jgi:hypothetical protein